MVDGSLSKLLEGMQSIDSVLSSFHWRQGDELFGIEPPAEKCDRQQGLEKEYV